MRTGRDTTSRKDGKDQAGIFEVFRVQLARSKGEQAQIYNDLGRNWCFGGTPRLVPFTMISDGGTASAIQLRATEGEGLDELL